MADNIAADLGIDCADVNIKAKTTERLGFAGRGEGIAAQAVVLLAPEVANKSAAPAAEHRVFFALWAEASLAHALADAAAAPPGSCTGRRLPQESLHMTLAFIGKVGAAQLSMLKEIAGQTTAPVFQVMLDQMVWWRRRHMVWAGATTVPEALDALVGNLTAGLRRAGFATEEAPVCGARDLAAQCPL